jgi:hypothetical protein
VTTTIDIWTVKVVRSQKPAPKRCAVSAGELPDRMLARATTAVAASARANASGNQRSNHSDRRRPSVESDDGALLGTISWGAGAGESRNEGHVRPNISDALL